MMTAEGIVAETIVVTTIPRARNGPPMPAAVTPRPVAAPMAPILGAPPAEPAGA